MTSTHFDGWTATGRPRHRGGEAEYGKDGPLPQHRAELRDSIQYPCIDLFAGDEQGVANGTYPLFRGAGGFKQAPGGFLEQDDWMNLTRAASKVAEAPIWIDDTAAPSILEVRAKARRFRSDKTIFTEPDQMGLIIVDYLQLARARTSGHTESREREVAEISAGLKALAKEVRLPVIALSQLRRAVEDRKEGRPQLSDLRESGAIEQDADLIAFIHASEEEKRQGLFQLIVGKHRNGPVGIVDLGLSCQIHSV